MFGSKKSSRSGKDSRVYLQNAVKTLVANIRFASVDDPVRTIAVTSSVPNEGKTTVSVALGQALAASGKDVLVVDCDLRRRSLANELGVHAQNGLYAVLAGQVELDDAIVETGTEGLYMLDVEPHIPNPVDILASHRFHTLVGKMRQEFGYVVIDTPPVSTFVDGAVIAQNTDATLLVVREGYTKRSDILAAYDQLQKAGANVIGTVLNFCENERSEYYYNYYNKDGKRVHHDGRPHSSGPKLPDVPLSQQSHHPAGAVVTHEAPAPVPEASPAGEPAAAVPAAPDAESASSTMSGLRPLPTIEESPADSTMAFLKQSGYKPKPYNYDE